MKGRKIDRKISDFMLKELPAAPKNQWFVRKVINRLPPQKHSISLLEKWTLLFAFIASIVGLIFQSIHIATEPALLVKDLLMMGVFLLLFIGLSAWTILPLLHD